MQNKKSFIAGALLAALVIGAISTRASAEESGKWECFVTERFPDYRAASSWKGALTLSDGLNINAGHVPSGAILTFAEPAQMVCVKK